MTGYQPCAHTSEASIGHAVPLPLHLADHSHIGGCRRSFAVRLSTNHERDDAPKKAPERQHQSELTSRTMIVSPRGKLEMADSLHIDAYQFVPCVLNPFAIHPAAG